MKQQSEAQRMERALLKRMGGIKALRAAEARFERNLTWLRENRDTLLKVYPDMWVAIHNAAIVGAHKDFKVVLAQVEEKGIHPAETMMEMLDTRHTIIVV